jgi:hypothetical protein
MFADHCSAFTGHQAPVLKRLKGETNGSSSIGRETPYDAGGEEGDFRLVARHRFRMV